jgi:hypothetical protein
MAREIIKAVYLIRAEDIPLKQATEQVQEEMNKCCQGHYTSLGQLLIVDFILSLTILKYGKVEQSGPYPCNRLPYS